MIVDLLKQYTDLERVTATPKGAKMLCPYHQDSSPSFHIHEERGFAKCFSCKQFRPLFTFLLEMGVPLVDAIEYQFNFEPNYDPEQNQPLREYELGYYLPQSMLNRGFMEETLEYFRVGYDVENARTTVPMLYNDKVYGIKYRVYPKQFWYSDNFRKEQFIYHFAPTKDRYYVEGETDTWRVWQNGTKEVSAILGSGVTEAQAELMSLHENVYLAYDPDLAGYQAIYQTYAWLRHTSTNVFVILYNAEDAGACAPEEWQKAIANPKSVMEFFIRFRAKHPELHAKWATWERGYTLTT